ncbi:MAG: hydrogenase maturation protease, partial [Candidatus Eisenbacteria bacterium]
MNEDPVTTRVIGVGNRERGDDAAGPEVVRRLADRGPRGLHTIECDGGLGPTFDAITGAGSVLVVDAMSSGATPGTVRRFDAGEGPLPVAFAARSTHGFGVGEAVELARVLGRLPDRIEVIGIEGACWDPGAPLSPPVEAAIARLVDELA